jgi:hypothetical protein
VENGLMVRQEYREEGQRARIEYPLTKKGQSLGLSFSALTEWSDHWIGNGSGPLTLRSKTTGQKLAVPSSTNAASRQGKMSLRPSSPFPRASLRQPKSKQLATPSPYDGASSQ